MRFSKSFEPLEISLSSPVVKGQRPLFSSFSNDLAQSYSFCDPFVDPDMEPRPLGPRIGSGNRCNHASPCVEPLHVLSLASLMILDQSNVDIKPASSAKQQEDPIQMLHTVLDPTVELPTTVSCSSTKLLLDSQHGEDPMQWRNGRKKKVETSNDQSVGRFRPYQDDLWGIQFKKLIEFKLENGHSSVPHNYREDRGLARWVKRQRYQYKQLKHNNPASTMTACRIKELEAIGFVWDSRAAAWLDKLNDLKAFKERTGHCNVPCHYPEDEQLSTWVKCQRRLYKSYIFREAHEGLLSSDSKCWKALALYLILDPRVHRKNPPTHRVSYKIPYFNAI
ncbi:unnamed protein product [Cylindrotheca closterium]|uniref:Helicase-associated domain-containing protein n=1 Tax=Cylindrotheca closterium TaxID=2856 RepID=A0AAD2FHX2_9STRA|nr:unnamed protein product [Cylindrotheca closterium]